MNVQFCTFTLVQGERERARAREGERERCSENERKIEREGRRKVEREKERRKRAVPSPRSAGQARETHVLI